MNKNEKRYSADNGGYSMVEMIIVIAIILILSAVGFLTINIVYGAKVSSARNTINSQFSYLSNMTRAQNPDLALKLYYDTTDGLYVMEYGTYNGAAFTAIATEEPVSLPDSILLFYTKEGSSTRRVIDDSGVYIKFNKSDGSVLYGEGTYDVVKSASNRKPDEVDGSERAAATIALNKSTGSHYAK